jgi:hypothetical protein
LFTESVDIRRVGEAPDASSMTGRQALSVGTDAWL